MKAASGLLSILVTCMLVSLTACQSSSAPRPDDATQLSTQRIAQAALDEGAEQYEVGNFQRAIKILGTTREINLARTETQVKAYKLLAFSYCSLGKTSLCYAEFEKILSIDPGFTLSDSERLHPIWGPIFEAVRKQQ